MLTVSCMLNVKINHVTYNWPVSALCFVLQITDANKARFEVPHEHIQSLSSTVNGPLKYEFELLKSPFGVRVRRASNKKVL